MQCSKCKNEGIVFQPYSGQHLCHDHFVADFEAKARRAIRVNQWMRPGDHIAVILDGAPAGEALLIFLRDLTLKRKDVRVSPVRVTGTIRGCMAAARESGATKIAIATSLEEAAVSVLVTILQGNTEPCFTSDPIVMVITPFAHIPTEEIAIYARILGIEGGSTILQGEREPLAADVKVMLEDYSRRHPAAHHAVLNLAESLEKTCRNADERLPHGP